MEKEFLAPLSGLQQHPSLGPDSPPRLRDTWGIGTSTGDAGTLLFAFFAWYSSPNGDLLCFHASARYNVNQGKDLLAFDHNQARNLLEGCNFTVFFKADDLMLQLISTLRGSAAA